MPLRRFLIFCLLLSGGLLALRSAAGLVDFSKGLIEHVNQRFGAEAPARLYAWQILTRQIQAREGGNLRLKALRSQDGQAELPVLMAVNNFFNRVPYYEDQVHWGVPDYWATPVETLGSNGGDCEDYSIAKYLTLKELGLPIERMRITYVRALNLGVSHMVLAYYPTPDADPLILDNLINPIKRGSERTDLEPVYSFNDDDLWMASGQSRKGGASAVRLWQELQNKLARERQL
ncbi:MAG: transglutaminase-like cysteine peptidase [Pseudomonadota bacterium]